MRCARAIECCNGSASRQRARALSQHSTKNTTGEELA